LENFLNAIKPSAEYEVKQEAASSPANIGNTPRPDSDIDLLIIADDLPPGRIKKNKNPDILIRAGHSLN